MEKYSKVPAPAEEAVNTKITKIEREVAPALYEDAPKKAKTKYPSQKLSGKLPKNSNTEESVSEETLEKL